MEQGISVGAEGRRGIWVRSRGGGGGGAVLEMSSRVSLEQCFSWGWEIILPSRGHLAVSRDFCGCNSVGGGYSSWCPRVGGMDAAELLMAPRTIQP